MWDDVALADWATPVAGLNMRPMHMTAAEYYSVPVEMFDPTRVDVRGGWSPPGSTTGAIPGHPFGLRLEPVERAQLIAFLRTL